MQVNEILKVKDLKKIKSINFTNPGLMADDADKKIRKLFNILCETKDKLYKARADVRELEESLKMQEVELQRLSVLFNIDYETYDKEVSRETEGFGIRGLGNEIIGNQTVI